MKSITEPCGRCGGAERVTISVSTTTTAQPVYVMQDCPQCGGTGLEP